MRGWVEWNSIIMGLYYEEVNEILEKTIHVDF